MLDGIGPPLVTPFTRDGDVDEDALADLVERMGDPVDFLVPCGSTSEAELLTAEERARVIELVAEAATVPVIAGTGHPGFAETKAATDRAADAGADAALVVTPFYYHHDDDTLEAYYEDIADASPLPIYLYSVPTYTNVRIAPDIVGRLAEHPNVAGMKDSSGDVEAFERTRRLTREADFDLFTGSAGVFAHSLAAGGDGAILAVANLAPTAANEVRRRHRAGEDAAARDLASELADLHRAVFEAGIPGLKAAMRAAGAPAGYARRPHRPVDPAVEGRLREVVADAPTG